MKMTALQNKPISKQIETRNKHYYNYQQHWNNWWASLVVQGKGFAYQCRRHRFDSQIRMISWRRKWQPNSNILAWEIPWTEEPGRLQTM